MYEFFDGARRECLRNKIRGLQADFTKALDFFLSKMLGFHFQKKPNINKNLKIGGQCRLDTSKRSCNSEFKVHENLHSHFQKKISKSQ